MSALLTATCRCSMDDWIPLVLVFAWPRVTVVWIPHKSIVLSYIQKNGHPKCTFAGRSRCCPRFIGYFRCARGAGWYNETGKRGFTLIQIHQAVTEMKSQRCYGKNWNARNIVALDDMYVPMMYIYNYIYMYHEPQKPWKINHLKNQVIYKKCRFWGLMVYYILYSCIYCMYTP